MSSSIHVPAVAFLDSGTYYITRANTREAEQPVTRRLFKAHYYLEPLGFQDLWNRLSTRIPDNQVENGVVFSSMQPTTHLLWALHYAFVYNSEDMTSVFFKVTPKTFRKYVWAMYAFMSAAGCSLVRKF